MYWRTPSRLEVINGAIDRVFVCAGVMLCGLESLLEAGRQILLEAIECQPEVIIRLPRDLNPDKKYSWRQKKDEPVCMTFAPFKNLRARALGFCFVFGALVENWTSVLKILRCDDCLHFW